MRAKWKLCTKRRYEYMFSVVPPLNWTPYGFQVGEAYDTRESGENTYSTFVKLEDDRYVECCEPLTQAEFRRTSRNDILAALDMSIPIADV